jgi:translation initiation factor IF-2
LARGKRPGASAPATKEAASGSYQPTSIQVVNHQREYKNPFAPEPAPTTAVVETVAAKVEQPIVNTPAEQPAPATPAPVALATPAPVETNTPAPQAVVEPKAELKILPPEEKARPAQSWEIGGSSSQPTSTTNSSPRREGRPDFRSERREPRQDRGEGRPENREPRGEFRPRERREGDRREQFSEQRREGSEPRREQRTFEPKPTPAVTEAKKSGFLGWLKGLFGGDTSTEQTPAKPEQRQDERTGEGRRYDGNRGGGRHQHRGGGGRGGRGGYRGDNRGENRGPQFGSGPEGQSQNQGGPNPESQGHGGEQRRFDDGNRGGGRRHHRGGRGRFRGDNRGGEHRSDGGPSNGPTS